MANDLEQVLKDANAFQEGLNAFENSDFSKQCPPTKLIFKDVENPDEEETEPPAVVENKIACAITVKDYCTGDVLPGALVFVNGGSHTANADGWAYLGYLTAGASYPVTITHDGYHPTADDTLPNDVIDVPEVPDA